MLALVQPSVPDTHALHDIDIPAEESDVRHDPLPGHIEMNEADTPVDRT